MDNKLVVFIEEYEFLTSFSCGDLSVDEMQISLKYSNVFPHKITGKITGNVEKYNEFVPLLNNRLKNNTLTFNSSSIKNQQMVFSSNDIRFSKITYPYGYPPNISFDIGQLELRSLQITENIPKNEDRTISYYLVGPKRIWNFIYTIVKDNKILPKNNTQIEIDEDLPFDIELEIIEFKKSDENNENLTYKYEVMSLTFKTKKTQKRISDDELLKLCTSYVGDILLLVSFIGRKRIEWFCYNFSSTGKLTTFIKKDQKIDNSEPDLDNGIIGDFNTMKFIKTCLPIFRKKINEKFDLTTVLRYYLSSLDMPYLEAEFSSLFTSLEYIKTLYVHREKKKKIISRSLFERLRKNLTCNLENFQKDNSKLSIYLMEEIIKKLSELNRFSISTIIRELCLSYDILMESLYPNNTKITLFETRNQLIHESSNIDIEFLLKEYYRLRLIIEMLILKIMNWEDFNKLNNSYEMKLVTEGNNQNQSLNNIIEKDKKKQENPKSDDVLGKKDKYE